MNTTIPSESKGGQIRKRHVVADAGVMIRALIEAKKSQQSFIYDALAAARAVIQEQSQSPYRDATERSMFKSLFEAICQQEHFLKSPPEHVRKAFVYLADRGWYLSVDFPLSSLSKLAQMVRDGKHNDVELGLIGYMRSQMEQIQRSSVTAWPERTTILNQAFEAHRKALYATCIPTMLAQADGMCREIFGEQLFAKNNKPCEPRTRRAVERKLANRDPKLTSLADGSVTDLFFEALRNVSSITENTARWEKKRKQDLNYGPLNRHGIVHGTDLEYATEPEQSPSNLHNRLLNGTEAVDAHILATGTRTMKLSYDPRHNIAYLRLHEKSADVETIRVSDELNVDIAPDGTVYGIELLNANDQLRAEDHGKLIVVNEALGEKREIPLAQGAAGVREKPDKYGKK